MNFAIIPGTQNGEFGIEDVALDFLPNGEQVMEAAHKVVERAREFSSLSCKTNQLNGEQVMEAAHKVVKRAREFSSVPRKTQHSFFVLGLDESDLPSLYAGESPVRFRVCDGINSLKCDAKVEKCIKDPAFNLYLVTNNRASGSAGQSHPFRAIFTGEAKVVLLMEWVHQEKDKRYELVFC